LLASWLLDFDILTKNTLVTRYNKADFCTVLKQVTGVDFPQKRAK